MRASIEDEALWRLAKRIRLLHVDPIIHVLCQEILRLMSADGWGEKAGEPTVVISCRSVMSSCLEVCTRWVAIYFAAFESTLETTAAKEGRPLVPALKKRQARVEDKKRGTPGASRRLPLQPWGCAGPTASQHKWGPLWY